VRCRIALAAAALSVTPLAQVAVTAAATDRPAASSRAVVGRLVIECKATVAKQARGPARGPCIVSGAITDRGRFVDNDLLNVRSHLRTLYVTKGTIGFSVSRARGGWRSSGERRRTPVFAGGDRNPGRGTDVAAAQTVIATCTSR
jgi:hypothetical protein